MNTGLTMKRFYTSLTVIFAFVTTVYFSFFVEAYPNNKSNTGISQKEKSGNMNLPAETVNEVEIPKLYYTVYTVKKGDIVGEIASGYGISQDAIISLNKLRNTRTLQIGQFLKIPSMDGIVYTVKKGDTPSQVATTYKISRERINFVNNLEDDSFLPGTSVFLPGAKLDWVTLQEINGDLFKIPLRGAYAVTSRYGWRSDPFTGNRSFHNGVDLVIYRGAPVYSALEGRVISTGYSTTYGNYVIVRHHSGYQTLYGHLNSILTSNGQYVTPATKIGTVGSTGRSTGPHLHFTVYKNGATINPSTVLN